MKKMAFYTRLTVEGIQNYIFSTGKLREMIGGSEIINYMANADFYGPILKSLGLQEDVEAEGLPGHYIVAQNNAGTLCLIFSEENAARDFMGLISERMLADYPGLPFYGSLVSFEWPGNGNAAPYDQACQKAKDIIRESRNETPVAQGAPLLPIFRASRMEALPAVAFRQGAAISLPSSCRSRQEIINRSRARLRAEVSAPEGITLNWADDLEIMLGENAGKVALICMDGNDLGKLFGSFLKKPGSISLAERIHSMRGLSDKIHKANVSAFNYACQRIAAFEAGKNPGMKELMMPVRALVMGGDDITLIARADIALLLVALFTKKFMEVGREHGLSLGIGMVVMGKGYPFAKAFPLAETLQDSAKKLTRNEPAGKRPSSLDYIVLTEDVENDIELARQRLYQTSSASLLTGKPFTLNAENRQDMESLEPFLRDARIVLERVARSQAREAWTECRKGPEATKILWRNLLDNIRRGIGGRRGKLIKEDDFERIFPGNFFVKGKNGKQFTRLGDYLEMERILPGSAQERDTILEMIRGGGNA